MIEPVHELPVRHDAVTVAECGDGAKPVLDLVEILLDRNVADGS